MIIKNFTQLASSTPRKQVLRILESGLEAISTDKLMQENFAYDAKKDLLYVNRKPYNLKPFKKIVVVGAGKMAAPVAEHIEAQMVDRIVGGLVIDIVPIHLKKIASRVGTHPLPSSSNASATDEIIDLLHNLTENDLVIAIIGGGGSSLMTSPHTISLEEERKITRALMDAGASINETNTVRKHFSEVKGGGFAKLAYPASIISLIFSDVPGDDLSMVASGPTVMDTTTIEDAASIIAKYKILDRCSMDSCGLSETPKEPKYFERVQNILFCSGGVALNAMQRTAEDLGLNVKIWNRSFTGEAKDLAIQLLNDTKKGECLIGSGESVVTIKSTEKGSGGRNQEMALSALLAMSEGVVFATLASDGRDNSDVAGSLVDRTNLEFAKKQNVDLKESLARHDEYSALLDINAAIITGVTGSNVSDLVVCLRYE